MWGSVRSAFCSKSGDIDRGCSQNSGTSCSSWILANLLDPNSCLNHAVVVSIDALIFSTLLLLFIHKSCSRRSLQHSNLYHVKASLIRALSAISNAALGLAYFSAGSWMIFQGRNRGQAFLPVHGWLVMLSQGLTWIILCSITWTKNLDSRQIRIVKICAVLVFLFSMFLCISSIYHASLESVLTFDSILDVLSFPGSLLLLVYALRGYEHYLDRDGDCREPAILGTDFYTQLPAGEETGGITLFDRAGFFSRMSFRWLNPLLKKGRSKILDDQEIAELRRTDQADTCYSSFMEELARRQPENSDEAPDLLSVILRCHTRAIFVSGCFALIKVLALATGPLFLKAFIGVAEGKEVFRFEGYLLTVGLFAAKFLESIAERQWFFRTRLIGLQVRSTLSAAIYNKQLRLSNAEKSTHSPGQILNYATIDAYRIGEFPYWFHQIWTTSLQICLALAIVYYSMGLATVAALITVILSVLGSSPLVKLQLNFQTKLTMAQDRRLKAMTEALANMKILKLYAWEKHFKNLIEGLRNDELKWILEILIQRGLNIVLFWCSPIIVTTVTFWVCYGLGVPLNAANVFTFLASLRILQEPIRLLPDVVGVFIEAKVSLHRIAKFLEASELEHQHFRRDCGGDKSVFIHAAEISWETRKFSKATLRNVNLSLKPGEKVAICGEVGSGKSTLLAAVLGEVPKISGQVSVHGRIAYVSQNAWIQTGTIQENILFGSAMDPIKYGEVLKRCCLVKDLESLPFGDLTGIGERGVNLSGGQKQRLQLARALYQDADIYLLDDPFSAVDAHTATSLFNDYVIGALSGKTVMLVTHQVDFLPSFNSILLMSSGEILRVASYDELLASSQDFQCLVTAHKKTVGSELASTQKLTASKRPIPKYNTAIERSEAVAEKQLIKQEEREKGDTGLKAYKQYLSHDRGFVYFTLALIFHMTFVVGQMIQAYWLAADLQNADISRAQLIMVYSIIGCILTVFLLCRSFSMVLLGRGGSKSVFEKLLGSLFRAPMAFFDSTPLGRILSRVSSDLSTVDIEVAFRITLTVGMTINAYSSFIILAILTWPVMFVIIPMIYVSMLLQKHYHASAKELMRIGGTTKSTVASHLGESISGAMTIRAFGEETRFFRKHMKLIDANAKTDFHSFSANEWLIQRLELLCAMVLCTAALAMILLPHDASSSGFIGMSLSYGLSLNVFLVSCVQFQCLLANLIVSVERLEQYMHIPSEAPELIESYRPPPNWPSQGRVEISNLKVRYGTKAPYVLKGISCVFEGGHKVGIVGRTGSGKSTLVAALFRLVEPSGGNILIDGVNICKIGLHDLRSRLGIIPQDPTLFSGSVRYNLDPLSEHTDKEIWEVLEKCQLREAVDKKQEGLDSLIVEDGSNWSMGQRQLFCLGRALLKRSPILVLDEATASMDNTTDVILQRTIRTEFASSTVVTVAHRIPTVMDCNRVLSVSDGEVVEYDEPMKLMGRDDSLFGQLVKEYWSYTANPSTEDMQGKTTG